MPPKKPPAPSQALVSRGDRRVTQSIRDAEGKYRNIRPSTERALELVLRNSKQGAVGTGELVLYQAKIILGQEKLIALADDHCKFAIRAPFNLSTLTRIAEAQFDVHIGQINGLHNEGEFYQDLVLEMESRAPVKHGVREHINDKPDVVANAFGYLVHNAYVLAGSWKLVLALLGELAEKRVADSELQAKVTEDENVRNIVMNLHSVLESLARLGLNRVRTLAIASEHYSQYFKQQADGTLAFVPATIKTAYTSYIDSLILEVLLPNPRWPLHTLFALLSNTIEEAPKDAIRCPQAMWDAVGDLNAIVQCLDMSEMPLTGIISIISTPFPLMEQFQDAFTASLRVSKLTKPYERFFMPMNRVQQKDVLNELWVKVDDNFRSVTGVDADTCWGLSNNRVGHGQWFGSGQAEGLGSIAEEPKKRPRPKLLANAAHESDDDLPPPLVSGSDSDEDTDSEDEHESENEESENDSVDEGIAHLLRNLERETMDVAIENPALFLDPSLPDPPEAKKNGLIRALRQLAGKIFSGDPTLTFDGPPRPKFGPERPPQTLKATKTQGAPHTQSLPSVSRRATVEDADEEEEEPQKKPKKKKKKKKVKKKAPVPTETEANEMQDQSVQEVVTPLASNQTQTLVTSIKDREVPVSAKHSSTRPLTAESNIYATTHYTSSASLATGQSAHSYLKQEGLNSEKIKIKSRPEPGITTSSPAKNKGTFAAKTKSLLSNVKNIVVSEGTKKSIKKLFGSADPMEKLAKNGPMKWKEFLKIMTELGFSYEGGTAGSSVRFDPRDPKNRSITIHKPHPGNELTPHMLKCIRRRLEDRYAWTAEQFVTETDARMM